MNTVVSERAREIKRVVCRVLNVDPDEVGETDLFVDDLAADSMKLVELLATLEVEFGLDIDEDELERLVNLRGVYEVLGTVLEW
jgi:acyl carrier protein